MIPKVIIFVVPDVVIFQKEFLNKFEFPINYKVLEGSDKGVGAARQIGLLQSTSELVSFIDDDDKVEPKYFERLLLAFNVNERLDAVGCWLTSFGYSKIVLPQFDSLPIIGVINCCPPAGILMWKRDSILAMGGFDQEFVDGYEDFDLVSRATVAKMRIKVIDEPLYKYRRHRNSTSSNYNFEKESNLRDLLFKKIVDFDTIRNVARLLFVSDQSVKQISPFYWRNERLYPAKQLRNSSLIRKIYSWLPFSIRSLIYNFLKSI
jgi:glycosyltransferase involved in cell wall biosynthesis